MRTYVILSFILFLLAACMQDEPAIRESYLPKPSLLGTYQAGAVKLDWSLSVNAPMEGDLRQKIQAERYVLEVGENDPSERRDFQVLSPDAGDFVVEELTNGQTYYFAIRAEGAGESVLSNVIMLIPRSQPLQESINVADIFSQEIAPGQGARFYGNYVWMWNSGPFSGIPLLDVGIMDSLAGLGATSFSWSPDHDRLLYELQVGISNGTQIGQIGIYQPSDGLLFNLTTYDPFYDHAPVWSADGQWIAYLSDEAGGNEFRIWKSKADASEKQLLTAARGDLNELVNKSQRSPANLAFSPDGQVIAFDRQKPLGDGYVYSLYSILSYGGSYTLLHDSPWNDRKPVYSPQGDRIAFFSDRSGQPEVWLLDLLSQKLTPLSGGDEMPAPMMARGLSWSPDGQKLLYIYMSEEKEKALLISL